MQKQIDFKIVWELKIKGPCFDDVFIEISVNCDLFHISSIKELVDHFDKNWNSIE